ncbi:pyridoxal-phosphate dependent enzyme [Parasedimentitalea huanghaiensis]|uniref:Pyridoxal-phosphate dependent enzyme n=1 Tax=Parasedimentitalea huanghaiensis TaxID=2682100 RepID=A0A6L6WFV5_9RHOB|nr:pyridoxal-phosphate dependent enzyme [Zongyanglinia huanghaiensis]MVO16158.1 pyridoxal-phosphate dependent enzyme [Zongyanglinia huanghaiensis]
MNLAIRTNIDEICAERAINWPVGVLNQSPFWSEDPVAGVQGSWLSRDWLHLAPMLGVNFSDLVLQTRLPANLAATDFLTEAGALYTTGSEEQPVVGGVPAIGGVFSVLQHARALACDLGAFREGSDPIELTSPQIRQKFSQHTISVAAPSNIGLAVGVAARALGFQAEVHLAASAPQWKIDALRALGATVACHLGHFPDAVRVVQAQAEADPSVFYVGDVNEPLLAVGYDAMALGLQARLVLHGVSVNRDTPLFLYFPKKSLYGQLASGMDAAASRIFGDDLRCIHDVPKPDNTMSDTVASDDQKQLNGSTRGIAGGTDRATIVVWTF